MKSEQIKITLSNQIKELIESFEYTNKEAASVTGEAVYRISKIRQCNVEGLSIEALVNMCESLGAKVNIEISA